MKLGYIEVTKLSLIENAAVQLVPNVIVVAAQRGLVKIDGL